MALPDPFPPVRAALIGAGWWGRRLAEATRSPDVPIRLHAVVDPDVSTARPFADARGLAYHSELEGALRDPELEAVLLATPHALHVEQVSSAAEAGKHVWCEKPLAASLAGARRAVCVCARARVQLAVGTDKRCLPAMRELHRLVHDGALGDLLLVEGQFANDNARGPAAASWRRDPRHAPAFGLTGPGLHVLDALVALAGPVTSVETRLHAPDLSEPADAAVVVLAHAGGVTGLATAVRGVPEHFRVQVSGTRGRASLHGFGDLEIALNGLAARREVHDPDRGVPDLLAAFARAVRGRESFPFSTASVLATASALEAAIASAERRARVAAHPVGVGGRV